MYEVRKDYPFYMPLKVLKFCWSFDLGLNKKHITVADVSNMLLLVVFIILELILPALHIVKVAKAYDDISSSEDIACMIGAAGFLLISLKTMYNNQDFNRVFKDLTETKRFGKPTTFDTEVKYCRLVSTGFLFYTFAGPILYTFFSDYESKHGTCMQHQQETTNELYCMSVYPIWLPIKLSPSVIVSIQLLCCWQLYTPAAQVCTILYEEVVLLISHMDFLASRLKIVFHVREVDRRSRILRCCAEYHSHIVKLALDVNELHMKITGHMALIWAVSIGCIGNQLISMYKPVAAILYLLGYSMGLTCFVIPGHKLQIESAAIAEKLYCTPWYLGTIEEQKIVMVMIMRAQIPLTLSAKPFGNYEYPLAITIVKTAYSYVTLLQSTT